MTSTFLLHARCSPSLQGSYQHPLASCCKMRVWETVNYNLKMEDILKWKWGRKFGGGGRGEIMKSSSAVSLERRILLEGEFKAFGKGKMVRWKAGFLSPRKGRKEERKGRVDVMYTWMVVSGLGRKKDSSCRSAALVLSTSEAADSQYLWTQTLTHSPGQN